MAAQTIVPYPARFAGRQLGFHLLETCYVIETGSVVEGTSNAVAVAFADAACRAHATLLSRFERRRSRRHLNSQLALTPPANAMKDGALRTKKAGHRLRPGFDAPEEAKVSGSPMYPTPPKRRSDVYIHRERERFACLTWRCGGR